MCPAAVKYKVKPFVDAAARPIAARLNSVAPGANLSPRNVYAIMNLCTFESVAKDRLSPFCSMFSEEDFEIYEYAGDIQKFYNKGCACVAPLPLACSSSRRSLGMGAHWVPFRVSDTSTNSLGASRILLHTTACKPIRPCFPLPKPSHWIGRCMSIFRMAA